MKIFRSIPLVFLTLLISCEQPSAFDRPELSVNQENAIKAELETIARGFLKSWEPPFNPDAAASFFTQGDDFHLVIDGYEIREYEHWAKNIPMYMADDKAFFVLYKHDIKYIDAVVLSPYSGVVTIVYTWESMSREGVHERTPGAITLTCREEAGEWKIVHYHGSHDESEIY